MKIRRKIARFMLILMLSVYLLPFVALTVGAESIDENEEFLKSIAGTYTWTEYLKEGFSSADEYRSFKKEELERKTKTDDFEYERSFPNFAFWYAMSFVELNVDKSGNISGQHSGSFSINDRHPTHNNSIHYFYYSLEVTSQIT